MLGDWVKVCEEMIKLIDEMKPEDRLNLVSGIASCNMALANSVNGWVRWLTDPRVMNEMKNEDLQEFFGEFQVLAKRFLRLDIKATKKYGPKEKKTKKADLMVV